MDILTIVAVLIIGILLIEVSKHIFTRTILKFIIIVIVGVVVLFSILSTLDQDIVSNTGNEYLETGAAIVSDVNEKPLILDAKENIKTFIGDIKEKVLDNR